MLSRVKIEQIYRTEARNVIEDIVEDAFAYELPEDIRKDERDPAFVLKPKFLDGYDVVNQQYSEYHGKFARKMLQVFKIGDDMKPKWVKSSPSIVQDPLTNSILQGAFRLLYNDFHSITNGEMDEDIEKDQKKRSEWGKSAPPFTKGGRNHAKFPS